jgi:hypothetical protein
LPNFEPKKSNFSLSFSKYSNKQHNVRGGFFF